MLLAAVSCAGGSQTPVTTGDPSSQNGAETTRRPVVTPAPGTVSKITITVDARNAYNHPDLPDAVRRDLSNEGLLISGASVTTKSGSPLRSVIESLAVFSIPVQIGPTTGELLSVSGIVKGFCGEGGYWVIRINGTISDTPIGEVTVNDGDVIELIFTCNGGEDLAAPGASTYTASPATPTPDPDDASGRHSGRDDGSAASTPEPTATPAPSGTPSPGDKTSGRH